MATKVRYQGPENVEDSNSYLTLAVAGPQDKRRLG